jgi:uroporphyrinogen-III synthase
MTSEALRQNGWPVDFEPEHPKMGFLVAEAAKKGRELLGQKRR